MEENTNVELDTVTNQEDVVEEVATDDKDALIAELQNKLKNKSIEARKAKKETKAPEVSSILLEKVTRMELKESGLKDAEEIDLVLSEAKELNIDPLVLVKKGYANSLLESHRKQKEADLANPSSNSRGSVNAKSTADYWIAKGELPPKDQVELRREVVNKKMAISSRKNKFNY